MKYAIFSLCLMSSVLSVANEAKAEKPPNIVLILTDDQGYGALGAHGHPYLSTPNVDKFYNESVKFDNFYVSPSCSPSRASLLTGRHEFRVGVTHTSPIRQKLNLSETILPQMLKPAGYTNGMFGKWHLGHGKGYNPSDRGFDVTSQPLDIHGGLYDRVFLRNGKREPTKGFREDIIFDDAIQFIDDNKEQPFFCYLATYSPHTPLGAPQKYIDRYEAFPELLKHPNGEKHIQYMAMVDNLDWNIGRVLQKLDDDGLTDNTIIIIMSDNGETWGLDTYNAGMRGCKASIWHGGSRAISIWKWGNRWKPKTSPRLTAHLDAVKTLTECAGVVIEPSVSAKIEGYSLTKLLAAPLADEKLVAEPPVDRFLYQHVARWADMSKENEGNAEIFATLIDAHKYTSAGIRQGDYLLLQSRGCEHPECVGVNTAQCQRLRLVAKGATKTTYTIDAQNHWGTTSGGWHLYDTRNDPACKNNLASTKSEIVDSLSKSYDNWWDDISVGLKAGMDQKPEALRP